MEYANANSDVNRFLVQRDVIDPDQQIGIETVGAADNVNVLKILADENTSYILKQCLNTRGYDHPLNEFRTVREAIAYEKLSRCFHENNVEGIGLPNVIVNDDVNCIAVYEYIPDTATQYHKILRQYRSANVERDMEDIRKMGEALAHIHTFSTNADFSDLSLSRDQRKIAIRMPHYHLIISKRFPEYSDSILDSVNTLLSRDDVLVHADYTPRNILSDPDDNMLWILDLEFAHMGHPAWDLASFLNYLFTTEASHGYKYELSFESLFEFWEAYTEHSEVSGDLEGPTVAELPVRILNRLYGRHPYPWLSVSLTDPLESIVEQMYRDDVDTLAEFVDISRDVLEDVTSHTDI